LLGRSTRTSRKFYLSVGIGCGRSWFCGRDKW
jgi:hypothetical protein